MLMQTTISTGRSSQTSTGRGAPAPASHALSGTIEMMGTAMSYSRDAEIFGEDEPAEYIYKVIEGAVRSYKVLSDGRRQIQAFHLPGDMFGLEVGEAHSCSAEAVANSKVLVIKRSVVTALAARENDVARQLWAVTGRELQRVQDHILLLIRSAQERVACFLLEMAARIPAGNTVELPMSRQDIADYLALTIETVSRMLTQLEHLAAIELPNSRRIVLRNRAALTRLNA